MQGELCTPDYLVMSGYDGDPDGTNKVIDEDGWLPTGDLAVMRSDGYFRITGGSRDAIIRGGENIYPLEIEEFIHTHPKVSDVQVVHVTNLKLGEIVLAWIRLKPGESSTCEEIREYCRGKISYFKIPQHVSFVESFPMTVSGKVQKFLIWEMEKLGLKEAANVETA